MMAITSINRTRKVYISNILHEIHSAFRYFTQWSTIVVGRQRVRVFGPKIIPTLRVVSFADLTLVVLGRIHVGVDPSLFDSLSQLSGSFLPTQYVLFVTLLD